MSDEQVLVVRTDLFKAKLDFQGLHPMPTMQQAELLAECEPQFLPRAQVEPDVQYKQLIPYLVVTNDQDSAALLRLKPRRIFRYIRTKKQGETRLHTKHSIGIGGHINPADQPGDNLQFTTSTMWQTISRASDRELDEELNLPTSLTSVGAGLLNDDSNIVGQVHLGLVSLLNVRHAEARDPEEMAEAGFVDFPARRQDGTLEAMIAHFETWSQILLRHFILS